MSQKGKPKLEEKKYWPLSMDEDVEKIGKKRGKKADGNALEAGAFLSLFAKIAQASNGKETGTG